MKAQVSLMYLASGGSKLFDPDWRGGLMMRGMVASFARLVQSRGIPSEWIDALQTPVGASLLAKGAIATELSLAVALWWPATRRLALWVGVLFHLSISLMTPVQLFTAEMLCVYLVFVTPDRGARVLRHDPRRDHVAGIVEAFDWLGRFRLEPREGRDVHGRRSRRRGAPRDPGRGRASSARCPSCFSPGRSSRSSRSSPAPTYRRPPASGESRKPKREEKEIRRRVAGSVRRAIARSLRILLRRLGVLRLALSFERP